MKPADNGMQSFVRKLTLAGIGVPDVLQTSLDKFHLANYPRIDRRPVAWFVSLPVLLTAWVARGSLPFRDLQLFFCTVRVTG